MESGLSFGAKLLVSVLGARRRDSRPGEDVPPGRDVDRSGDAPPARDRDEGGAAEERDEEGHR